MQLSSYVVAKQNWYDKNFITSCEVVEHDLSHDKVSTENN